MNSKDLFKDFDRPDTHDYINKKICTALDIKEWENRKKKFYELKQQLIIDSIRGSKDNAEYYLKFSTIVLNEKYFHLDHIKELGLEYDILIFLSKKGIGKSYYMIQQLNEWMDDGKGIATIFRLTDEDLPAVKGQMEDYGAKFDMDAKGFLAHRQQFMPDSKKPEKMVPRRVGRACGLLAASKLKGGGYTNLRGIIFDEATDKKPNLNVGHFNTFFKSILNSIERENKNVPFLIFGNTDGCDSAHPLFQSLGIDPDENLVYIKRQIGQAVNETKILYINSRMLYTSGAQHSKMIGAIADPHQVMAAFMNESIKKTTKILALDLTCLTDPIYGILFTDVDRKVFLCKVSSYDSKHPYTEEPIRSYFICIEEYDPVYTWGWNVYTNEEVLKSVNTHDVCHVPDETIAVYWDNIRSYLLTENCFFIGSETQKMLSKYLKQFAKSKTRIS